MDIRRMLHPMVVWGLVLLAGLTSVSVAHAQGEDLELVTNDSYWLPESAVEHGAKVDGLFTMIFVVTVVIGAAVFMALLAFLWKYRYQEGRKAIFLHGNHRLEMIWTLTPAIILVAMGILSIRAWADIRIAQPGSDEEVTEIEVLAKQFQWDVRYPGRDGKFDTPDDIGTFDPEREPDKSQIISNLYVPVGKPVRVHLMSRDVLHSFFLPNMRQKLDAVPGLRGTLNFTPTRTGKFDLMCAELCGPQHYAMQGALTVLPQEEYDEWLQEQFDEIQEILDYYADDEEEYEDDEEMDEDEEEAVEDVVEDEDAEEEEASTSGTEESPVKGEAADEPALITDKTPADAIVGRILYAEGETESKPIKPGADKFCNKVHQVKPILEESIVAGKGGALANVFVEVVGGLPDKKWPVPANPVVLDQKGCHYIPHVFGMMAGQQVLIRTSDATSHNVHGLTKVNESFNFPQPNPGMQKAILLTKSETFKIKCDVHAWMNTWCHVVDHPYFAVTGEDGVFTIAGLPAGEYELKVWHETLGEQTVEVTLAAGAPAQAETVTFEKGKRRR